MFSARGRTDEQKMESVLALIVPKETGRRLPYSNIVTFQSPTKDDFLTCIDHVALCFVYSTATISCYSDALCSNTLLTQPTTMKRPTNDENAPVDSAPAPKRQRRVAQEVSLEDIANLRAEYAKKAEREDKERAKVAEELRRTESKRRIAGVLESVTAMGYESLYGFIEDLLGAKDQQQSAHVSRMLGRHAQEIMDAIRLRQPEAAADWAFDLTGERVAKEGLKLAEYLRPAQGTPVSEVLQKFSLEKIMAEAESIAPKFCQLLRLISSTEKSNDGVRKDRSLVSFIIL